MDVQHVVGHLLELCGRGAVPVDPGAALAVGVNAAPQEQGTLFRFQAGFGQPRQEAAWTVELGADVGTGSAFAHHQGIGTLAQGQLQRVDQNGFARAGFAGEHRKPGMKVQLERGDDDKVADGQPAQHHTTPSCQRSLRRRVP